MTGREIIDRLEKLTGPSREVDALIAYAVDFRVEDEDLESWRAKVDRLGWDHCLALANSRTNVWGRWLPHSTGSLDAIVALIEQKLPGWIWDLTSTRTAWLMDAKSNDTIYFVPEAKPSLKAAEWRPATHAIALCIALLRALPGDGQ